MKTATIFAALRIQRAWRRNAGMGFWARKIVGNYPFFALLREEQLLDSWVLAEEGVQSDLAHWVRRLLLRCGVVGWQLPDAYIHCWAVFVNFQRFPAPLVAVASELVKHLLRLLGEEYSGLRTLVAELEIFALRFLEWSRADDYLRFVDAIRDDLIEWLNTALRHGSTLLRLQESMPDYQNLHALYCVLNRSSTSLTGSHVYRAILQASHNPCWTPTVSQARLMHELILDNRAVTPLDQSLPRLGGTVIDSPALRDDLMATLIGFVDDAAWLRMIAEAFHATRSQSPEVMAREVFEEVFLPIVSATAIAPRVRDEWALALARGSSLLEALVLCLRLTRNMLDNMQLDAARQTMAGHFDREAGPMWATMQISQTECTARWIRWCLGQVLEEGSQWFAAALATAHPFALMEFFDTSVVGLILPPSSCVDFLAPGRLPEFLAFDLERLLQFRSELSGLAFRPCDLVELIGARKWMGPRPCPPALLQVAERMRAVLELCRFCHAAVFNRLAARIAKEELRPRPVVTLGRG